MTIAAESLAGRVLAVFSRRSPGFRPPLQTASLSSGLGETSLGDPAQEAMAGLSLAEVTARWKSVPPQERLRRRGDLLAVADFLKSDVVALLRSPDRARRLDDVRARARALDRYLGHDLGHDRYLVRDLTTRFQVAIINALDRDSSLDDVRARARELDSVRDLARDRDRARDLAQDRDRARDFARDLDRDLDLALVSALNRARDRDLNLDAALVRALDRARGLEREHDRNLFLDRTRTLNLERDRDLIRALVRDLDPALDHDLDLDLDFIEAHHNLISAANNFIGADLTIVDLVEVDLAGVRWDSDTQWPTPEWKARIRTASVEDPPGSGVFVVLPEEGHNFADRGSLAPTS